MNQICAKVYYLIATGEVLVITSECQGYVKVTTKTQDITIYPQLQNKTVNEIDYIELEYGILAITFKNAKSFIVNITTKQLEVTYYTQAELDAMNNVTT